MPLLTPPALQRIVRLSTVLSSCCASPAPEMRPVEILDRLEQRGGWGNQSRPQRLTFLTGILWHENQRGGRVRLIRRGYYGLSKSGGAVA